MKLSPLIFIFLLALSVPASAATLTIETVERDGRISSCGNDLDWVLSGRVVDVAPLPFPLEKWYITLEREIPGFPMALEYLTIFCEGEEIIKACAALNLFDQISAGGVVRSNEPLSGQRLKMLWLKLLN